jgi:hypothetical protein
MNYAELLAHPKRLTKRWMIPAGPQAYREIATMYADHVLAFGDTTDTETQLAPPDLDGITIISVPMQPDSKVYSAQEIQNIIMREKIAAKKASSTKGWGKSANPSKEEAN